MASEPTYIFPDFEDLPTVPGAPQGCVWGMYDKDGKKDEVGAINLLTPAVVRAASFEIRTGRHVQLDWALNNLEFPGFHRKPFEQKVIDLSKNLGAYGFDDEIHINTQSGSQWDSLKHHAYQPGRVFYNGLTFEEALTSNTNGIHNWCERGGIVGRGILIDMVRFYEKRDGKAPHAWERFEISVADLKAALADQGTLPKQGDLLMIRSGYVRQHDSASSGERRLGTLGTDTKAIGVASNEEMVRWLYSQHFSAHIGDTVAFEAWPPPHLGQWIIHEWSLVWWGAPIGEMWNLEGLAAECEKQQRWNFFLTSAPLHVKGGIGSPPGAIAIF